MLREKSGQENEECVEAYTPNCFNAGVNGDNTARVEKFEVGGGRFI